MPDALDKKLAELEHRLITGHEQIGRGIGVPFLLVLYPPSEELRARRDMSSLVAKLRSEGRQVEVIDCNQVLLDYLNHAGELQRAIRAEKRNPGALYPFLLPNIVQERLAGQHVQVPVVFLVPAEEDNGGDYRFLGIEKARRYRGTYL